MAGKQQVNLAKSFKAGGESGIRTHVRVSPKHAFQACAFSHSAISPKQGRNAKFSNAVATLEDRIRASDDSSREPRFLNMCRWPIFGISEAASAGFLNAGG